MGDWREKGVMGRSRERGRTPVILEHGLAWLFF